jgi:hypothetical protein
MGESNSRQQAGPVIAHEEHPVSRQYHEEFRATSLWNARDTVRIPEIARPVDDGHEKMALGDRCQ